MSNESVHGVLLVVVLICFVCSVVVASTAVYMRPLQEANREADINRNILQVAGLYRGEAQVEEMLQRVRVRYLDLRNQQLSSEPPPDADEVRVLSRAEDIAGIQTVESVVKMFLVYNDGQLEQVILPVRGYGLWSTLRGFFSVKADGQTVQGLQFYDHKETPGLGGEVDNPKWRKQWRGKLLYNEDGALDLQVIKGRVRDDDKNLAHRIDGLAGATLTSRGVTNMLRFWFDDRVYGTLLKRLRDGDNLG